MLTPKFSLDQDTKHIFIHIHAPFIKLSEADCYADGDEFYFHAEPYFLRLHLPGEVSDDEQAASRSEYNSDSGQLTVYLSKKTQGQHFEGLGLLTKLLTPKNKKAESGGLSSIEVVHSSSTPSTEEDGLCCSDEGESDFDWFVEQQVRDPEPLHITGPRYGFAQTRSGVLKDISSVVTSLADIKQPDQVTEEERRSLRLQQETISFDCEHYLADFCEEELIQGVISFHCEHLVVKNLTFTDKEQKKMTELPRREYLIDKSELKSVYLGLVDLVYAYCYNYRFTCGEEGVESDWTICKLSSTLSWFESFANLDEVLTSCFRRCLCFPLYRNWKLCLKVLEDVRGVFKAGKNNILRCLLGIHTVLSESESRYPLNDLYITDYCVWLQVADDKQIQSISEALEKVNVSKSEMNLNLEAMEEEASALMNGASDDEEEEDIVDKLATAMTNKVSIKETAGHDSDDGESDEESEEESSTDSSSGSEDDSEEETSCDPSTCLAGVAGTERDLNTDRP